MTRKMEGINPLKAELNPICHLLALLGAHHILHVSRVRVKLFESDLIFPSSVLLCIPYFTPKD
jgi:transposase